MPADVIFRNGSIYIEPGVRAEALAIRGGQVLAAGSESEVMHTLGPGTRVIDLAGRAVVPGLTDSHLHLLAHGLALQDVDLGTAADLPEALARIRQRASALPEGEWILARGMREDRWPQSRLPTRRDLDQVAPRHPVVVLRACLHVCVANTTALQKAGITPETADPPGGQIDRDEAGKPTGVLREMAVELVTKQIPPPTFAQMRAALAAAVQDAARHGITEVHSDDVRQAGNFDTAWRLWNTVAGPEAFPLRAYLLVSWEAYEEYRESGLKRGDGNGWVRAGPVKLFADGSLGGRTALLREPYADAPHSRGIAVLPPAELSAFVARCHRDGHQVACHCIGDEAIDRFLDAVEAADRQHPRPDHRHRVIHALVCPPDLQRRMAGLGVVADIQPRFIPSDASFFEDRLGPDRARWFGPWNSLIRLGIPCCGGSDCPVEPLHMPWHLHAARTRQGLDGTPPEGWNPSERLSVTEALALYTTGAAFASFAEQRRGRLLPGMDADLVVLDRDPHRVAPGELKDLQIHLTLVGGRVAYEA